MVGPFRRDLRARQELGVRIWFSTTRSFGQIDDHYWDVEPSCIARMFFIMTASAVRSSALGLNHKISMPGSLFTGTWPGGV